MIAGLRIKNQIFAEITSGLDGFDGVYDVKDSFYYNISYYKN